MVQKRFRRLSAAGAVGGLLLTLGLAGCSDDNEGTSAKDKPGASSSSSAPEPVVVKLLDAGSGDKRALRIDVEVGHTETMTMSMATTTTVPGEGELTMGFETPTMFRVTDVQGDELTMEGTYGTPTVTEFSGAPGLTEADFEKSLSALSDLKIVQTATRRGEITSAEFEASDALRNSPAGQALQSMESQIASAAVPLPQEEVGVGARWEAKQSLEIAGIKTEQVAIYELTSLTADGFTLDVASTGTSTGTVNSAGTNVEIDNALSMSGTVKMSFDLIGPEQMDTTATTTGTASAQGETVDIEGTVSVRMRTR